MPPPKKKEKMTCRGKWVGQLILRPLLYAWSFGWFLCSIGLIYFSATFLVVCVGIMGGNLRTAAPVHEVLCVGCGAERCGRAQCGLFVCLFVCLFDSQCSSSPWWSSPHQGLNLRYPKAGRPEADVGRSSRIFFKKGLGRRGKGPEKVHVLASHNRNSSALDLEASSLRDIAWVRLRSILFS